MEHAEERVCKMPFAFQSCQQTHLFKCTVVALLAATMLTFTLVRDRWGGAAVVSPPDHPRGVLRSPPSRDATAGGADKYSGWLYHDLYELFGKFLFQFKTHQM